MQRTTQVNVEYPAEKSLVLRYWGFQNDTHATLAALEQVSQREGVRVIRLTEYRGVSVDILDLTSLMATRTFEDLVAVLTAAVCLDRGWPTIVISSGGNLAAAVADYAARAGIEVYAFLPRRSLASLDRSHFSAPAVHLYGVAAPALTRPRALAFARELEPQLGYQPMVPLPSWRYRAFRCLGYYLMEQVLERRLEPVTWISQTVSAGFGPLGIYQILRQFRQPDAILSALPRLLCVQQAGNCRAFELWSGQRCASQPSLLIPKLFDSNPDRTFGTYRDLFSLVRESDGQFTTVDEPEFRRYITPEVIGQLADHGISITLDGSGWPVHRAGLVCLAGVLKAIDNGVITHGHALVSLTEGTQPVTEPAASMSIN